MSLRTFLFCGMVSVVLMALGAIVLSMPDAATTGWALLVLGIVMMGASIVQSSWVRSLAFQTNLAAEKS